MSTEPADGTMHDGHGAALARALGQLVQRLVGDNAPRSPSEQSDDVRDALRTVAARAREGALKLHAGERGLVINGRLVSDPVLRSDPLLQLLSRRLATHNIGALAVRQGAAPSELLTLGRLLADTPSMTESVRDLVDMTDVGARETPVENIRVASRTPHEVLRSWSVRVTPTSQPSVPNEPVTPAVGGALSRLHASHSDAAATAATEELLQLVDATVLRGDAVVLEGLVTGLVAHARFVGPGAGRLATEGALRRLLTDSTIELLATRIPVSADRDLLVSGLARAGEVGVRTLVAQLMQADDLDARRSYFDAIVALDAGVAQLREALSDSRWYVVGNAAALLAEMGVSEADVDLVPLLLHDDDRIRIRAARALTRLRTPRGLSALQRALPDSSVEVRRLAAASYGLSAAIPGVAKPPTAPLVMALNAELEEEVALEMIASLGLVGSADAVQRLVRHALTPTDGVMRPAWFRIAALEAIVAARGLAAEATLEAVLQDDSAPVVAAAQRLLLKIRPG